jgi:hypothetical protein
MPRRPNMNNEELRAWFFNQRTTNDQGCWEWTGVRIKDGYGMLSVKGQRFLAHRYALGLHLGRPIMPSIEVRHICHNPPCFNPEHLEEGTHQQNMTDMVIAERQARGRNLAERLTGVPHPTAQGEGNGRAKLTSIQVLEIHALENSMSRSDIAKRYNVSKTAINGIVNGTTWKNVMPTPSSAPPKESQPASSSASEEED